MSNLTNPTFTDETAAREWLESVRWPDGPYCPHCGTTENVTLLKGKSQRPGLYQCNEAACRKNFTVTVGTLYERSHIALHKWLLVTHLLTSSKKGISAHQIHRMIGITYKSAWFMCHRIREAMRDDTQAPMGGGGQVIEADETYIGPSGYVLDTRTNKWKLKRGGGDKLKVLTLVERDGKARSIKVDEITSKSVKEHLEKHAKPDSILMTDEAKFYRAAGKGFDMHSTVNHKRKEYVRGPVYTNTVEGFFSIFKRGMIGTYQHCGEQHLQRYLQEFDFRYNHRAALGVTDAMRAEAAIKGITGKRLTYR